MLYKVGGLISGTAIGAGFICNMDDVIYGQLRRNVILPFKQTFSRANSGKQIDLDDLLQIGSGTANFASQFKPHALGRTNVKALLINDEDYNTPQDHYFGYINKMQQTTDTKEKARELDVMGGLGIEVMLPPTFNIDTGKFDDPVFLDKNGNPINEEEMDIFELAALRKLPVSALKEL